MVDIDEVGENIYLIDDQLYSIERLIELDATVIYF